MLAPPRKGEPGRARIQTITLVLRMPHGPPFRRQHPWLRRSRDAPSALGRESGHRPPLGAAAFSTPLPPGRRYQLTPHRPRPEQTPGFHRQTWLIPETGTTIEASGPISDPQGIPVPSGSFISTSASGSFISTSASRISLGSAQLPSLLHPGPTHCRLPPAAPPRSLAWSPPRSPNEPPRHTFCFQISSQVPVPPVSPSKPASCCSPHSGMAFQALCPSCGS